MLILYSEGYVKDAPQKSLLQAAHHFYLGLLLALSGFFKGNRQFPLIGCVTEFMDALFRGRRPF